MLNENNEWCSKEEERSAIIQRFYENLFTSISPAEEKIEELLTTVKPLVTESVSRSLERGFSNKEVKNVVFSMSGDKNPRPDGMNAIFYQQHWDIVGPLVSKAVLDCLNEKADMD